MKTLITKTKGEFLDAVQDLETKIKNSLGYTVDYVLSDLEEIQKDLTTLKEVVDGESDYCEDEDAIVVPVFRIEYLIEEISKKVKSLKNELES